MRDFFETFGGLIIAVILCCVLLFSCSANYNSKEHSDDVMVTEWISPDGVHYWYQQQGYHAMLAPRYDSNGNLVIDNQGE